MSATSFKTPYENEVPLTTHMCKVAKLSPKPMQSLFPPFRDVNADDSAYKSSSGTSMQPVTQLKAKTDKKLRRKKIPSSSDPKASKDVRVPPLKKQVADT
ncbi:hypothetical protein Tco_1035353 [Tanacetum coccineum]